MLAALGDIDTTDALPVILVPGALEAATRLAGMLAEDENPDLDSYAVLGRFFWLRYAVAELYEQTLLSGDAGLLTEAVALWRRILDAVPGDHPDRATYKGVLGAALYTRYTVVGHRADLDEGMAALQEAIAGVADDHDLLPSFRLSLSSALGSNAGMSGGSGVLDQAIATAQQALGETTGEEREYSRAQLGWTHVTRYQETGDPADLDAGTAMLSEAIAALPANAVGISEILVYLSEAQHLRFVATGDPALLAVAIDTGRCAVDHSPDGHPIQVTCWGALGAALLSRAQYHSDDDDFDTAIALFARGIERAAVGHPARAMCEANLGQALLTRYPRTGRQSDLDTAIDSLRHALERRSDCCRRPPPGGSAALTSSTRSASSRSSRTGRPSRRSSPADDTAVHIATLFYRGLQSESGTLNVGASAQALHDAVRRVRGSGSLTWYPSVWAAHIHAGS